MPEWGQNSFQSGSNRNRGYEGGTNRRPMDRRPMERRPMGMTDAKKYNNDDDFSTNKRNYREKSSNDWNNNPRSGGNRNAFGGGGFGGKSFGQKEVSDKENEDRSCEEIYGKQNDRDGFTSNKGGASRTGFKDGRGNRAGYGGGGDREQKREKVFEQENEGWGDGGGQSGFGENTGWGNRRQGRSGDRNGFDGRNNKENYGERRDRYAGKENNFKSGGKENEEKFGGKGDAKFNSRGRFEHSDRDKPQRLKQETISQSNHEKEKLWDNEVSGQLKESKENVPEKDKVSEKPRNTYIPPEPPSTDELFSNGLKTGINFAKYDHIPLKVTGENTPKTIRIFSECNLCEVVTKNIKKSTYKVPTPIQKIGLPVILSGRDLMGCAQTGSGKTAAFLVPIIHQLIIENVKIEKTKPYVLILAPTRELAIQIYTEARKFAFGSMIKSCVLYGGTSTKHQNDTLAKGCHILIATPGRFLDFVEKGRIKFDNIRFLVLDEADRMLDLGFKDSIEKIMNLCKESLCKRQTLMFSATFPKEIQIMASDYLTNYIFASVGAVGGACADITQVILEVPRKRKREKLLELLAKDHEGGVIVFVETKRGTDFIASFLSEKDYPSTSIHGDRLQSQRELALHDFKRGKMKVLVATSVAARGLDIKGVRHVINFDLPSTIEDYVHRIGRTGRLGNNGRATSFFDPERDSEIAAVLIKILEGSNQKIPEFLRKYASKCAHKDHTGHFGANDIREEDEDY